ncbi:protein FAR1-RELATED SEQUENCE 4-like [Phoenix dactylifera]|uniref:Protein FAR1-RELATED SEQUENCE 4-like n=1 Tax=Phoenix dactylifera TaxID=42345 RepID=A0A8B8JCR1_PHODC|nr:protein FAR1-RELATED SEQUENCE 4-like [Phoenix dactylifera]
MVRISEITEDAANKEGEPREGDGEPEEEEKTEERLQEERDETKERTREPAESNPAELATPPAEDPNEETPQPAGKVLSNDYALRVAYIMRSYLSMRQGGAAAGTAEDAAGCGPGEEERCRAMMEVVRKESGRWAVSRVVLEHTHPLEPPPDPAGALAGGGLLPRVDMEFDSVSAAKAYYSTYGEKMGFKAQMGSGKRSRGNRILIMQRFLCSKGSYPPYGSAADSAARKRKRGPYKKRAQKDAEEAKKDGEVVEVIQVESLSKKPGAVGDEHGGEAQGDRPKKRTFLAERDLMPKEPAREINSVKDSAAADKGQDGGKVPLVSNPAQSKLLRDLGIRVSRYTHEERRDIVRKYMQKKSNRQAVDRSIKIPSRQALAERRQRGVGGKFLSKEEMQTLNRQEEPAEEEPELPEEVVANAGGVPIVGMVFENEAKAYDYYVKYAGSVGFSVRKGGWDKSARNNTRSRVYICSREGFRPKNEAKRPRPETRTGCPSRMAIKITSSGKYRVTEFVPDHNHQLAAPLDIQMLKSEKLLTKVQPRGCEKASLIPAGYKNYLRAKRSKDMQVGDTGALLEYLQKMKGDNPSFYYAIQVDEYDQMTNVFWADAKSMIDYHYFGDVVCFDTTYKANNSGRPFSLFIGVNHHKQTVIFGAAFLYDETVESFKWLFETFKTAMSGKQPKTILTDRCAAIRDAIGAVWPGTTQHCCVWQIYQHAMKHLAHVFEASETFAHDFSHCIYDFEDEEEFLAAWNSMLEKYNLKDNEWLTKLYEEREKWALVYCRHIFCADIKSTLQEETLSTLLKEYLNSGKDLSEFLKLYEMLVNERRYAEVQADYHVNQGTPRIPPLRLLWQAANEYTPAVFEMFRREFELFMDCMVYSCGEVGTLSDYEATVKDKSKEQFIRFDSSDGSIMCSCRKFEHVGIQCCHVLKVLDFRNIKELPPQYLLKRWRKDAKAGSIREGHGLMLDGDPETSQLHRYNSLCRILYKIAARAAENEDTFTLMLNQTDQLLQQVERILQTRLLEKPSLANASRDQHNNLAESGDVQHDNNYESQKMSGKKKNNGGVRHRHQSEQEANRRQKVRKGQPEKAEVAPGDNGPHVAPSNVPSQSRNPSNQFLAPNHFMQGPYVSPHQFGLGTAQNFHPMAQFGQDSSSSALQQQLFHGSAHLTQGYPTPDIHALQFVGSNPQLDHQGGDQGHCAIPVWDFL